MDLQEKIYGALKQFATEYYGESADDACYDLSMMAKVVLDALEKEPVQLEMLVQPGTRIRCISMNDGPCEGYSVKPFTVPSGTLGTVTMTDDAGQIHISWDCGSSLALIPGVDEFEILSSEKLSDFSIKRTVLGKECEIRLTFAELEKAYRKAAYDYRLSDIKAKLTEMISDEEDLDLSRWDDNIPEPASEISPYSKALRELYKRPEDLADDIEHTLENHDSYWEAFWLSIEYVIEDAARELAKA